MTPRVLAVTLGIALCASASLPACEREARRYHDMPAPQPGQVSLAPRVSPYQENAFGIAEGKRLFTWYNCNGCHAHGGGAIGPALMDDKWIYGASPDQIHASIVEGRPNGMPAFGGRIPDQQVWQLVAYVQSLGGDVPKDAAPGRSDHMAVTRPELRKERERPRQTGSR